MSCNEKLIKSKIKGVENDTRKLPGHGIMLQSSVILDAPVQFEPPKSASIFGDRLFVLVPPPHDFEQVPTAHSSHSQSTLLNIKRIKDH